MTGQPADSHAATVPPTVRTGETVPHKSRPRPASRVPCSASRVPHKSRPRPAIPAFYRFPFFAYSRLFPHCPAFRPCEKMSQNRVFGVPVSGQVATNTAPDSIGNRAPCRFTIRDGCGQGCAVPAFLCRLWRVPLQRFGQVTPPTGSPRSRVLAYGFGRASVRAAIHPIQATIYPIPISRPRLKTAPRRLPMLDYA